jgi:hypothetical protein
MIRRFSWIALVVVLVVGAVPLRASSLPSIQGGVAGIELCEQAVCGAAIFTGLFNGQVAGRRVLGSISVAVKHDPLPLPGDTAAITGGIWGLQVFLGRAFSGILTGGTLHNNGDGTFQVITGMLLTSGGVGTMTFQGTLSHNTFPPTISGQISQ